MTSAPLRYTAGVDYLTLTLPATAPEYESLEFFGQAYSYLLSSSSKNGRKAARVLGYIGEVSGTIFYGARPDGWLFRVSGAQADACYAGRWPASARCTRIDLALTVWYADGWATLAHDVARSATEARDNEEMHRSTRICLYDGMGDGDSTYIGSRSSEQMLRVYDKGAESAQADYKGSWRWEIEYKGERAAQVRKALVESVDASGSILATVDGWLSARGVVVRPGVAADGAICTRIASGEGNDTARLAWLARSVRPTVAGLIDRLGESVVYSALGLRE